MTENLLFEYGYVGLFMISFLAATFIPLGSEVFVAFMSISGYNPWYIFLVATAGNSLGSLTNYYIGKYGGNFIISRYIRVDSVKRENAEIIYRKWGSPALFFAWLPVIGDPLTLIAGVFRLNLYVFNFWVILGKGFRYATVILAADTFFKT